MVTPLKDGPRSPDPMIALIEDDDAGCAPAFGGREIPLADVRLLHPIARPSKNVICVGKNYREHAEEFSRSGFDSSAGRDQQAVPDAPIVFSKAPCALAGARDDILVPAGLSESVDYEGELGVVIGRRGRAVKAAHAYDHVFGYAVINDATCVICRYGTSSGCSVNRSTRFVPWVRGSSPATSSIPKISSCRAGSTANCVSMPIPVI